MKIRNVMLAKLLFTLTVYAEPSAEQNAKVKLLENRIMQLEKALKQRSGAARDTNNSATAVKNSIADNSDVPQLLKKLSSQMRKLSRDVKAIKKSLGIKNKANNKIPAIQEQSIFGESSPTDNEAATVGNANLEPADITPASEQNVAEQQFKIIEILYNSTQNLKLSNTQRAQKRNELSESIRYFLQVYGKEPQAKQAMYWLGCTYLDDARAATDADVKKSLYHNAKVTLVKAYQADRSGNNTPDCLLKIGEAMYHEGRTTSKNDACTIWAKLKADFPDKLKDDQALKKHLEGFISQASCK